MSTFARSRGLRKPAAKTHRTKHHRGVGVERLEDRTLLSFMLGEDQRVASFYDASGDRVIVELDGPGAAIGILEDDAADSADLYGLFVAGTDRSSRLTVQVRGRNSSFTGWIDIGPEGIGELRINGTLSGEVTSLGSIGLFQAQGMRGATVSSAVDISQIRVHANVVDSAILAGLDTLDGVVNGNDILGPGSMQRVIIGGRLRNTTIAAGVAAGTDGLFGTSDDVHETDKTPSVINRLLVRANARRNAAVNSTVLAADNEPHLLISRSKLSAQGELGVSGVTSHRTSERLRKPSQVENSISSVPDVEDRPVQPPLTAIASHIGTSADTLSFLGASPPVKDSIGALALPKDLVNEKAFRWQSSDRVLRDIDTGLVVSPSTWTYLPGAPARLVFVGRGTNATVYGNVLFDPYDRAVVDVVKGTQRLRYLVVKAELAWVDDAFNEPDFIPVASEEANERFDHDPGTPGGPGGFGGPPPNSGFDFLADPFRIEDLRIGIDPATMSLSLVSNVSSFSKGFTLSTSVSNVFVDEDDSLAVEVLKPSGMDPATIDTMELFVASITFGARRRLTVFETGPNTATFASEHLDLVVHMTGLPTPSSVDTITASLTSNLKPGVVSDTLIETGSDTLVFKSGDGTFHIAVDRITANDAAARDDLTALVTSTSLGVDQAEVDALETGTATFEFRTDALANDGEPGAGAGAERALLIGSRWEPALKLKKGAPWPFSTDKVGVEVKGQRGTKTATVPGKPNFEWLRNVSIPRGDFEYHPLALSNKPVFFLLQEEKGTALAPVFVRDGGNYSVRVKAGDMLSASPRDKDTPKDEVTVVKVGFNCLKPLKQYLDNGTDCVYRRGPKNKFSVEVENTLGLQGLKLSVTDPGAAEGTTKAKITGPVIQGNKATFTIEVPADNPVGIYKLKVTFGDRPLTAEHSVFIIFDVPPSLADAETKAYLYDEGGTRDENSYHILYPSVDRLTKGTKRWYRNWSERNYVLSPFDRSQFLKVIEAINGATSENTVAEKLMNAISNIIKYSSVNGLYNVLSMFAGVTKEKFKDAYRGIEKPLVMGQCLDYANGLASVMRSIGIPARVATKIEAGGFLYHQWTEAYLEKPDEGTDRWFMYDAMDNLGETDPPKGKGTRAAGDGPPTDYSRSGFEVIVGDTDWKVDGGMFRTQFTNPPTNNRVGLRRMGANAADALFEKCEKKHYSDANCPDIDPDGPDPFVSLTLDQSEYRVGETATATLEILNTDPIERTFDFSFRFFIFEAGGDGRDAFGDPVAGIPGTGVLGTTLLSETQTLQLPANSSVVLPFSITLDDVNFGIDGFGAEVFATAGSDSEHALVDLVLKPAYELLITEPPSPMIDEPFTIDATLANVVSAPITNLAVTLDVPEFYGTFDTLTRHVSSLDVGGDVRFSWNLFAVTDARPHLQHFRVLVTSNDGGMQDEAFTVQLQRPATPLIRIEQLPTQVLVGQAFQAVFEVENIGDVTLAGSIANLSLPPNLSTTDPLTQIIGDLTAGQRTNVQWNLMANATGSGLLTVSVQDATAQNNDSLTTLVEVV